MVTKRIHSHLFPFVIALNGLAHSKKAEIGISKVELNLGTGFPQYFKELGNLVNKLWLP